MVEGVALRGMGEGGMFFGMDRLLEEMRKGMYEIDYVR